VPPQCQENHPPLLTSPAMTDPEPHALAPPAEIHPDDLTGGPVDLKP
jgi:hypothetical protein